jgi:GT2 family glycosyltransferase
MNDTSEVQGTPAQPLVSVIVLNYNGARWISRCLESLRRQTIFDQLEILVVDNASPDKSDLLAAELMSGWSNGRVLQLGGNYGYCEGNNRGAARANGKWLFFLNNDAWLEPSCLEELIVGTRRLQAQAACPLILDYDSDRFQSMGAFGFDIFGLATARRCQAEAMDVFMPEGCGYLIAAEVFSRLGQFDPQFFMFSDEFDLSWRLWASGNRAVAIPNARMHHRGAAQVNPAGGEGFVEIRTSATKRYFANRNALVAVLKNASGLLLMLALFQAGMLILEAIVGGIMTRRLDFVRKAYWGAFKDTWRLREHVLKERKELRKSRQRGDVWMLRFLRFRLNRWDEMMRIRRMGLPRVTDG